MIIFLALATIQNFHVSIDSMPIVTLKQESENYGPWAKSSSWPIFSIAQEVRMVFTFLSGKEKKEK